MPEQRNSINTQEKPIPEAVTAAVQAREGLERKLSQAGIPMPVFDDSPDAAENRRLNNRISELETENRELKERVRELLDSAAILQEMTTQERNPEGNTQGDGYKHDVPETESPTRCPISEYASYSEAKAGGEKEFRLWERHCYATELCAKEFARGFSDWQHIKPVLIPQMTELYGIDRCKIVLASTIQLGTEFNRNMYSREVAEEAARVKIPGASKSLGQDARWDYYISDNPAAISEAFQKICEMEKKIEKKAEKDMEPAAQNKDKTPKREILGPVL